MRHPRQGAWASCAAGSNRQAARIARGLYPRPRRLLLGAGSAEGLTLREAPVPVNKPWNPLLQRHARNEIKVAAAFGDIGPGGRHVGRLDRLHVALQLFSTS